MKFQALLALSLFVGTKATPSFVPRQTQHGSTLQRTLSVRGGDLGGIKSKTLAQTVSVLASLDAAAGLLAPRTAMKWCGIDIEQGTLSEHYLHGIGASAATTAVALWLSISGDTSVEKSIGYGFVARLLSMAVMFATNKYHELGMNLGMFGGMFLLLSATTYALFTGNWEPKMLAKLVSLLLGFHGIFLYLKPDAFMKKATGKDAEEPLAKNMASIDGGYMMVSAMVTGFLAGGVDPEEVAGYASIAFMPVIGQLLDVVDFEIFGLGSQTCIALVVMLLSAIATGTLFDA